MTQNRLQLSADEDKADGGALSPIARALFELLAAGSPRSVSPETVARHAGGDDWRRILPQVRAEAVGLARAGRLVILRHGRPADPDAFKGVYRLGLPDAKD
jgi:hypothetical protein